MPNRHASSDGYRYGFQGQEKDEEIKGEGNSLNYKYRMHDPRVGRFFATDPLTHEYPHYSPYSFSGNKVISYKELEGLEELIAILDDSGMPTIRNTQGKDLVKMLITHIVEKQGERAQEQALNTAVNRLGKGDLVTNEGSIYNNSKRMKTINIELIDGTPVKDLKVAKNIGWKKGDKLITTRGINQLENFLRIGKSKYLSLSGKFLGNIGLLMDIAKTVDTKNGEINPFEMFPLKFLGDNMVQDLEDSYQNIMFGEFNQALNTGIGEVETFLSKNSHDYTANFELINVSSDLMKKVFSGEIKELNNLYDAVVKDEGEKSNSIVIDNSGDKAIIRAYIIKEPEKKE